MRLLVEPGSYACRNMGDLAMFLATVSRLERHWPEAEIVAFTAAPDRLQRYAPSVLPVSQQARQKLLARHRREAGAQHRLPFATRLGWDLRRLAALAASRNWKRIWDATHRLMPDRSPRGGFSASLERLGEGRWERALRSFSLVAVSGAGWACDPCPEHAASVLDLLSAAHSAGVPTALFSQGMGSMQNTALRSRARVVLPHVDFIGLRECRKGPALLRELGVPADRIHITGDDALELAYSQRKSGEGDCLGVSLRLADYANMRQPLAASALRTVADFAGARGLEVLAIPISFDQREDDYRAIAAAVRLSSAEPCMDDPTEVARRVARCRLVVTGSYHGAVFALAQGTPVVAVCNSLYYSDKLLGLADMFGTGCQVVDLSDPTAPEKVDAALERFWNAGAGLRGALLDATREQIRRSQAAYQTVFEIVSSRSQASSADPGNVRAWEAVGARPGMTMGEAGPNCG